MTRSARGGVTAAVLLAALLALPPAAVAKKKPPVLRATVTLTGAQVVGKGDPDGRATATLTLDRAKRTLCWKFTELIGLGDVGMAAHLHRAPAGKNGPVVVPFIGDDVGQFRTGRCEAISSGLATAIAANPKGYYVNVHTAEFPNGAVRGIIAILIG